MQVDIKYNIGDRIWILYEPTIKINNEYVKDVPACEITLYDDYIDSIIIFEDEVYYALKNADHEEIKEQDIILYEDRKRLLAKIYELMDEINQREERS